MCWHGRWSHLPPIKIHKDSAYDNEVTAKSHMEVYIMNNEIVGIQLKFEDFPRTRGSRNRIWPRRRNDSLRNLDIGGQQMRRWLTLQKVLDVLSNLLTQGWVRFFVSVVRYVTLNAMTPNDMATL